MTDQFDLSSRLLVAIEAKERIARDVARGSPWGIADRPPVAWGEPTPDTLLIGDGKLIAKFDAEYGGYLNADHVVANDPDSVLRLCQAHREIVEMYLKARNPRTKGIDHASAMGRLTTLGLVLQALARGYGIEEGG